MKKCIKNNKNELYIVEYDSYRKLISVRDKRGCLLKYVYKNGMLDSIYRFRGYNSGILEDSKPIAFFEYDDKRNLVYYENTKFSGMIYDKSSCIVMFNNRIYNKNF